MSRSLIIACTTLLAGSLGVVAAQHHGAASHQPLQMLHSLCDSPANQGTNAHVPEHFAKMLNLSTAQLGDIEKLANEACAVMKRTHEGILQVLTPEQRAKVREIHGGD